VREQVGGGNGARGRCPCHWGWLSLEGIGLGWLLLGVRECV
jgi:hypothetical protein